MTPTMRYRVGELVVPAIVLLGCLLYWLGLQEARSVARRVPDAVILFTAIMSVVVLIRGLYLSAAQSAEGSAVEEDHAAGKRDNFVKRLAFIALCIGYFAAFSWLGFNIANGLFLFLAYLLAGLSLARTIFGALISSLIFYGLARVMEFNVPVGPLGF